MKYKTKVIRAHDANFQSRFLVLLKKFAELNYLFTEFSEKIFDSNHSFPPDNRLCSTRLRYKRLRPSSQKHLQRQYYRIRKPTNLRSKSTTITVGENNSSILDASLSSNIGKSSKSSDGLESVNKSSFFYVACSD